MWVKSKNGRLRICPDYKVYVNTKICIESYPLPQIETTFAGARFFPIIDLSNAYWQVELDKESANLCAINTTKDIYLVTRLQMGMKNSSATFQDVMENIVLKGLANVIAYQDGVAVYAKTKESFKSTSTLFSRELEAKM